MEVMADKTKINKMIRRIELNKALFPPVLNH